MVRVGGKVVAGDWVAELMNRGRKAARWGLFSECASTSLQPPSNYGPRSAAKEALSAFSECVLGRLRALTCCSGLKSRVLKF